MKNPVPLTYLKTRFSSSLENRLKPGTAIATFENGRYPNRAHGNHVAFYLGQAPNGIYVMDQWNDPGRKARISRRYIRAKGKNKSGKYIKPSDNADAFSVIE